MIIKLSDTQSLWERRYSGLNSLLPPKVNTTLYASYVIRPGEDTLSKRGESILAQRTHNVAHRGGVIKASQCHLKGKNHIIDKNSSYRCTIGSFHTYILNTGGMLWLSITGKKKINTIKKKMFWSCFQETSNKALKNCIKY